MASTLKITANDSCTCSVRPKAPAAASERGGDLNLLSGSSDGGVVFDGPASQVDRDVLTRIYGDEDWTAITQRMQATAQASQNRADNHLSLTAA